MGARAEAVAATRERILDAVVALYEERDFTDVSLDEVAGRAGTTVPTVLRHFGTKAGMTDAAVDRENGRVADERGELAVGDVHAAVRYLSRHYEERGDLVLRLLAAERRSDVAATAVGRGRDLHRAWVARIFAPWLEGLGRDPRRRRHALLVAATDVYVWKLLRRDAGLGPDEYVRAVGELLHAINGGS